MIPIANDLLTARRMLRDGSSLTDAAIEIGWSVQDLDLMLWRYAGRREALPKQDCTVANLIRRV